MTVIIELAAPHPKHCKVCGGKGRIRVAGMRRRAGSESPAWVGAAVLPCPLSSGADGLHALFGSSSAPTGGVA